ncbi:MAG: hypothetical protein GY844_35525 [Bradyrhizobium sp.]|nr:hypothetical protein [Bradyrhizobium sp.]
MRPSYEPPGRFYVFAAIAIAVVIWMVMGSPGSVPANGPTKLARIGAVHR